MFHLQDKNEQLSGYIILNEDLQIEEFSGQINQILRREHLDLTGNLEQITEKLKKNIRLLFLTGLLPAVKNKQIRHFTFDRKKSRVNISVTPINSGATLLSFHEIAQPEKPTSHWLPELLDEIVLRINAGKEIIYASANLTTTLELSTTEVLHKTIADLQLFQANTEYITQLTDEVMKNKSVKSEEMMIPVGGEKKWWNISVVPDIFSEQDAPGTIIVLKDISKQKLAEEKYLESEQRYEIAMEASDLGVWDYDVGSGKTFYSRKWKSILGYYPDEVPDNYSMWEDLLHPDDKDRMTLFISNFLQSDLRVYEAQFRLRHKNGHYIWIKSRAIAIRDKDGNIVRMLGTHRDITEEKKSESEYEKLYQAIMQSPISVLITDRNGHIEFFNPAFCKISGWKDQEILGKKPNILKSGFHPHGFYEKLWRTICSGNEWQGEFKNRKKNGDLYWELASISPIKNSFGTITHFVKIAENISYLKKIEKDLKKAKQDAEIANNYKNNFLANMSHEIRTPINTIIGFSELIKNESLSSQKRNKYSEIIEENSQALLRLIDDIIDIAKIEANELKIKKEACSLKELFAELEMTYTNFLKRKHHYDLHLNFHVPEEQHHEVIFTDPYRLKQIINNLYINALRHTEKGQIDIGYEILNENKLQFFVSDTGKGIPSGQIRNIFQRFIQSENESSTRTTGAGLGLSICKDLANMLGGDIQVKSVEGEGSVFYVTLPYDKIKIPLVRTEPKRPPTSKYNFRDYTIMIAEDTPYNYEYLYNILYRTGASIIWAKDGIDVLKLYNASKVDLILMDIQLPEISGYDATVQIRSHNPTIPIIAQTAYAMADEKQKCLESGCNEVLVKPIRIDDVLTTVAKYLLK